MNSLTPFFRLIRLALGSGFLAGQAMFPLSSFATVCDGGSNISDIREKDGALKVIGKFGQTASTSDMGKTWSVDKRRAPDFEIFWNKSFVLSNDQMYQNVPIGDNGAMYVITKKKKAKLWEDGTQNLILFARDNQLFSFKGKLYRSGMSISLLSGEIYGTTSNDNQSEIRVEVSNSYVCKLTFEHGECRNPYSWDSFDRKVTGFYAQESGNFFLSTSDRILYFDAKADHWSNISTPYEWAMQCT
ncbi:hypothetical protein ACO0K9_11750 [Undibacterium sp. Ji50W]|uniref:hypothetical protein n=1 Tax=Undibacterium sp. Ji50W TaxID=3413041 RepID=UPI003BF389AA